MADSVGSTLKQEALENLKKVAFAKMTDFIDILPGGEIKIKDLSQIPPEQMVGIRELEFDEADPTRIRKISLHDSFWALHLLGLHTVERENTDPIFDAIATFRNLGFEVRQTEEGFELIQSSIKEQTSDDFSDSSSLVDIGLISKQEQAFERYDQPSDRSTVPPISVSISLDIVKRIKHQLKEALEPKVPYSNDPHEMARAVIFVQRSRIADVLNLIEALEQSGWSRGYRLID